MNIVEYKRKLKSELNKLWYVKKVITEKDGFYIVKHNGFIFDEANKRNKLLEYLKDNNLKISTEYEDGIYIDILDLDKYKEPKTELDIKIEELEKQLKELKEKRKIEKIAKAKQEQIKKLKDQLKKLEENTNEE